MRIANMLAVCALALPARARAPEPTSGGAHSEPPAAGQAGPFSPTRSQFRPRRPAVRSAGVSICSVPGNMPVSLRLEQFMRTIASLQAQKSAHQD